MQSPQEIPATAGPAPLLTERQACVYLQLPLPTFRGLRYRGSGPPEFKIGRLVRFRQQDLEQWVQQWTSSPSADAPP